MTFQQKIRGDMTDAMRAKQEVRLSTLRGVLSAFTNELVAKKRKPTELLSNDEAMTVVRRLVKQRKDSIEQFRKGGREDLAQAEAAEMKILEEYLPVQVGNDEITKIVKTKMAQLSIVDKSKASALISTVMKELKGQADGSSVKKIIDDLLAK
ncbi:MAG: hypothetical protein A3G59_00570 [Candidatus Taylorbacteria bacterium RIFCSPLOWO2_12_FULL_47_20]|uniref:Glutamyl-tRNA amidotransferase n=1 Tax=Candidatus Taylorbacteria bacterium RIFCSPLOWO2_12_FULL_47_20 TaxID=1802335 RepID=A0A1G2P7V9_9BACT|nr:MAG: hypothetical protein A3G59_00570 [Candidatus Taylorbacteria bacterium RIFCSPLOWO2_12_FULL_47_20]